MSKYWFELNKTEQDSYNTFCIEHSSTCGLNATIGGRISLTFTPTSLGCIKTIKCNVCKEEKDITDYNNW